MPKLKCDLCGERKGKRICPARDKKGICPQCCAEHRVRTIRCLPSCPFLGGEGSLLLAQTSADEFAPPPGEDVRALIAELMSSSRSVNLLSDAEPAAQELLERLHELGEVQGAGEVIEASIWEWLVFGARAASGQMLLDRVAARLTRPLSPKELTALGAVHRSHYHLLRSEGPAGENRLGARDLLSEERMEISTQGLSERFPSGQCLAAAVTPTSEGLSILIGAMGLPEGSEQRMIARIRQLCEESPLGDLGPQEYLTRCSIVMPILLYEHFASSAPQGRDPMDEPPPFL
ncbi:MAG: hypothetical protein RBU30_05035 [Polyangia bacterium]|mgnify:CR=1 FL=1|nr:hypothetical protein [Polyangia bacterium]